MSRNCVVTTLKTLMGMAAAGHITLHEDTGKDVRHWTGAIVRAWYIENGEREFVYRGKKYITKYLDGCFNPFVINVSIAEELGIDLTKKYMA